MSARLIGLIAGIVLVMCATGFAQVTATTDKQQVTTREVEGTISSVSSNFLAVECGLDSDRQSVVEMAFTLDKNVKLIHRKSLAELKYGDTVKVVYDEVVQDTDNNRKLRKNKVKAITFLKPAPKALEAEKETAAPKADELQSSQTEDPQLSGLTLKGVKGGAQ